MPSTKRIIKDTLRERGLREYDLDSNADLIKRVAKAVDENPTGDVQQVVTEAVGSDRYRVGSYIPSVVTAIMTARRNGSGPQDATPRALPEAEPVVIRSRVAERLREYGRRNGYPQSAIEGALAYAGLLAEDDDTDRELRAMTDPLATDPQTPNEDQRRSDVNEALDLLTGAVQALRTALRS